MIYLFKQHALVGWKGLTPNSTRLDKLPLITISSCGDGIKFKKKTFFTRHDVANGRFFFNFCLRA